MTRQSFKRNTHAIGVTDLRCPMCGRGVKRVHIDTKLGQTLDDYTHDSGVLTFEFRVGIDPCGHTSEWRRSEFGGAGPAPLGPPSQRELGR